MTAADGATGEAESIASVCDPDRMRNAAIFGEISLEEIHLFAENKVAAIDHLGYRGLKIALNSLALRLEVDKRDWFHR